MYAVRDDFGGSKLKPFGLGLGPRRRIFEFKMGSELTLKAPVEFIDPLLVALEGNARSRGVDTGVPLPSSPSCPSCPFESLIFTH